MSSVNSVSSERFIGYATSFKTTNLINHNTHQIHRTRSTHRTQRIHRTQIFYRPCKTPRTHRNYNTCRTLTVLGIGYITIQSKSEIRSEQRASLGVFLNELF